MKLFENWYLDKAAKATAAVTGGMIAAPLALGAVGFTAGGVAAGSIAAGIQSGIGCVAAGSACECRIKILKSILFKVAGAQSAAATGAVATYGALAGGAGYGAKKLWDCGNK